MRELHLQPNLATSLASGHPWVYRDHVGEFRAPSGCWVRVVAGSFVGVGLWDDESAIAVRIFSTQGAVDYDWIKARVLEAWDLRSELREAGVTGYRLIFGEADSLPGIVVDLYGQYAVLVSYSKSLGQLVPQVAQAVFDVLREGDLDLRGVVRRTRQDGVIRLQLLCGDMPPDTLTVQEYGGMQLIADLQHGQKTGLFFDHRDNRAYVKSVAEKARVLNLFSYTGGFSIAAALGGADHVTSVDISAPAISASRENFVQNGLDEERHDAIAMDVFDYLKGAITKSELFDIVICDPPSFAKNRMQLKVAEKAYRALMSQALLVVRPGGLFCAASCTSQVGPAAFRLALVDAGRKARQRLRVVRDIGQPVDHPVAIAHEEGRYLKFLACRVYPRC